MNKIIPIGISMGIVVMVVIITGNYFVQNQTTESVGTISYPVPPVTQQDLQIMIDEWMNNPDEDDTKQRIEIMKAYYTFEETGQKLTQERDGLLIMNQIRKMVSLDMPKEELDQLRQDVREEIKELEFN